MKSGVYHSGRNGAYMVKKNKIDHLWWVITVLAGVAGAKIGTIVSKGKWKTRARQGSNKYWQSYLMMDKWVRVKQEGKSLVNYFVEKGYKSIAIYGMSYSGITLLDELMESEIEVKYGIDANADKIYSDIPVLKLTDHLEDVDAVIVTPIYYFNEIEKSVSEKMSCPVIPLDDVIFYS